MWNRKSQKEKRDDSVISTISLNIDVYILDSGKSDVNQTKKTELRNAYSLFAHRGSIARDYRIT